MPDEAFRTGDHAGVYSGVVEPHPWTAEWGAGRGGIHLDDAIMTVPPDIGTADAQLLYSGPRSAFDTHEPTPRSLGGATTYLGADHGLSSLYDMSVLTSYGYAAMIEQFRKPSEVSP